MAGGGVAEPQVPGQRGPVPLGRVPVAPAAGAEDADPPAPAQLDASDLGGHRRVHRAADGVEGHPVAGGRPAPGHALGGEPAPVGEDEGLGRVGQQLDLVFGAQPAPEPARPSRVGPQRPLGVADRVGGLEDLHRGDGGGGQGGVAVVEPVAHRAAPQPAPVEGEHHPPLAVGPPPGHRQGVDGAVGAAVGPLGRGLGHRPEDQVHDPQDGLGVPPHRTGPGRVEQRSGRQGDLDRRQAARVGGHVGEEVLEGHVAGGPGGDRGDVDRPGHRRRGAGEVHGHVLAPHPQLQADRHRGVVGAVVVQEVLGRVGPVGQRGDAGPHQPGRPVGQLGEGGGHRVGPVLADHLPQPPPAQVQGVELGVEVAVGVGGHPADAADQVHHVGPQLAPVAQLHGRDQHPLLGALGGRGVVVAGDGAPHVGVVAHRRQPAEQPAPAEVGLHQLHVVEVGAAPVGVVEDPHVAGGRAAGGRGRLDGQGRRPGQGPGEDGQAGGALHQGGPGDRVVDAVGGVVGLGDDRVEGRPEQGGVHLVHQLLQAPLQHGQGHRVQPAPSRGHGPVPGPPRPPPTTRGCGG